MANLFLDFTGLCAFVPRRDITFPSNPADPVKNAVRVLLVNASQPPTGGGHHHAHEPHAPVLICDYRSVERTGNYRKEDIVFNNGNEVIFFLNDQDVSVRGQADNSLLFYNNPAVGNGCHTPGSSDYQFFDWVAPLSQISSGAGIVKPACLNPPGSVDSSVIARVKLTEGRVRTYTLAKDSVNYVVKWDFRPVMGGGGGGREQALAEVVRLELTLTNNFVDLSTDLLRLSDNPWVRALFSGVGDSKTIRLKPPPAGGDIRATIKNVPWADIFGPRPAPVAGHRPVDGHFEHYYSLSLNPPVAKNVPHPLPQTSWCPGFGGPSTGTPQCPPNRFDPDSTA